MNITPGSAQHQTEYYDSLIASYYENVWNDEIYLARLKKDEVSQQGQLVEIQGKIDRKEYKTKNEGEKKKFVAERELLDIQKKIEAVQMKLAEWPERIKEIEEYKANISAK